MNNVIYAFIYFLACYGLSWILVYGKISLPFRQYLYDNQFKFLSSLFECIVCTSWWVSLVTLFTPYPYYTFQYPSLLMYLFLPFSIAAFSAMISDIE
jgi:hypothetical protein